MHEPSPPQTIEPGSDLETMMSGMAIRDLMSGMVPAVDPPASAEPPAPAPVVPITIEQGDKMYLEGKIEQCLISMHESVLALRSWEPADEITMLQSAQATILQAVHDTMPIVEWPKERTRNARHLTFRTLCERLQGRIKKSLVLEADDITSEDDPRIMSCIRDIIAFLKAGHQVMVSSDRKVRERAARSLAE